MMEKTFYIVGGILILFLLIFIKGKIKRAIRKSTCKNWKVGDMLILHADCDEYSELRKSGKLYALLKGWSLDSIYIDVHDGYVKEIKWGEIKLNKSAYWREAYQRAKDVMGSNPDFSPGAEQDYQSGKKHQQSGFIDGKSIDLLTEVECEVYLKKAIEDEDYKTAEAIRKRMEHFR